MTTKHLGISLAATSVLLLVLNFVLDHNSGTIFIMLAVAAGLASFFTLAKDK